MNRTLPAAAMTAAALLLLVGCTGDAGPETAATAATAKGETRLRVHAVRHGGFSDDSVRSKRQYRVPRDRIPESRESRLPGSPKVAASPRW